MKSPILFVFVLIITLFFFNSAKAQFGWQWGFATVNSVDIEANPVAVDKVGNVFVAGYNENGDSVVFGSITIYNPTHNRQLIIAKADSFGFIWAKGSQNGFSMPVNVATDDSGNVYLLGEYYGDSINFDTFTFINPNYSTSFMADYLVKYHLQAPYFGQKIYL